MCNLLILVLLLMCLNIPSKQTFYLIDESQCTEEGAESVVSMAHHYLKFYGIGEKHAQIHFDNAAGQNKNNLVIWCAVWRTLIGLDETVALGMLVAEHTKFAPDWHFGVWKVKWRDSDAEPMAEVADTVMQSSRGTHLNLLIAPEVTTILEHQDVNLSCTYNNNMTGNVVLIYWYAKEENDSSKKVAGAKYSDCKTNLIGHTETYITDCEKNINLFNLTWKNVSRENHGKVFTCQILTTKFTTSENEALIRVNVPVKYININATDEVNENSTITVQCVTSPSRPKPNITCFVHGNIDDGNSSYIGTANHSRVQDDSLTTTVSLLQFIPSRRHNGYDIFCKASNLPEVIVESNTLQLNVKYPPDGPPMLGNYGLYNKYEVIEHHNVTLTCYSSGGNPLAQLNWTCNERFESTTEQIEINNAENTKAIISWNASRDSNTSCNCSSTHNLTPTYISDDVEVKVLYPPDIPALTVTYIIANRSKEVSHQFSVIHIMENETVAFSCSSNSEPPPTSVTWTGPQSSESEQNVITMIKRNQNGTYYCQVINAMKPTDGNKTIGNATRSIDVSVLYPPTIHNNITVRAIEGRMVSVPCIKEYGNPTSIAVNWLPTSDEPSDQSVLVLANVSRNDDNNYTCNVNYTMLPFFDDVIDGNIKRQIHLEVVYKAVVQQFIIEGHGQNEAVTVTENDTVILLCFIDSKPEPSASIRFQDSTLDSLQINETVSKFTHLKVGCTDAGSYTCSGLNEYNNGTPSEKNFTLFVKCPPRLSPLFVLKDTVTSPLQHRATMNYTVLAFPIPGPSGFKWEYLNTTHWANLTNSSNLMILNSELKSELIFLNVSPSSYGQYRLRISNGFPELIQNFSLVQPVLGTTTVSVDAKSHNTHNMTGAIVGAVCGVIVLIAGIAFGAFLLRKSTTKPNELRRKPRMGRKPSKLVYQNIPFNGKISKTKSNTGTPVTDEISLHVLQELDDAPPLAKEPTEYYNSPETIENIKRIGILELFSYVEGKNEDSFAVDYQKLPTELQQPCTFARRPENIALNRYNGIYPYDHSRVKLEGQPGFFINACYIHGYARNNAYIASLGPTSVTTDGFNTFWKMVWYKQTDIIVMLTNLNEPSGMKCEQYWPDRGSEETYGEFDVSCHEMEVFAEYTRRSFTISKAEERRTVTHLHYTAWPDKKVPEDVASLIEFRHRLKATPSSTNGPIIVHCSAGIGRTGTLIALDRLIEEGQCKGSVNVFECINSMREQRVKMVQTLGQYIYIFKALVNSLFFECEPIPFESFQEYVNTTNNNIYSKEFQQLMQSIETDSKDELEARAKHANLVNKNRHGADIPGGRYRVCLYLNRRMDDSDYINAVYINSFKKKDHFITAQSPLPGTVLDFVCMIYQEKCCCVVTMEDLTRPGMEVGVYFPSDGRTHKCGDFKVSCTMLERKPQYIVSEMRIKSTGKYESGEKVLYHFQYNKWMTGNDTPADAKDFVQFIKDIEDYADQLGEETSHVLVYCLKANERSALYCVVSILMEKMRYERQVSVLNTVRHLRTRRRSAITSMEQLKFCYQAVSAYITMLES